MVVKARIVEALGEDRLLLPALIEAALAANERAKYLLALLQNARLQADQPTARVSELRRERLAAAIADSELDRVVAGTQKVDADRYRIPGLASLLTRLDAAVATMISPFADTEAERFGERLARLSPSKAAGEATDGKLIRGSQIDAMTTGDRREGDSLHILIMDLHKALNRLQAAIATETIDGASTYGLSDEDRVRVRTFMRGLNRTRPLKFDHPGLATTATEAGGRLLLQNDLGTTDAHVLVVTVEALRISITYTDVHAERLLFFQGQFEGFGVDWSAVQQRSIPVGEEGSYALTIGTYTAANEAELERFLDHLGSRLVFLIDWNRARKRLRTFVGKDEATRLLTWAAVSDLGHRGFLELGGEKAVYEAMEFASAGRFRFGDRLIDVLGAERTCEFLKFVIEASSRGLQAGRSPALIKDEIKVRLRGCLQTTSERLLAIVARHGAYTQAIAAAVHAFLLHDPQAGEPDGNAVASDRLAERAGRWEQAADALLNEARTEVSRAPHTETFLRCFDKADDAADRLEEAAFLLTLMQRHGCGESSLTAVTGLAALLDDDARVFVSAVHAAGYLARDGRSDDLDDFLTGIERIVAVEHEADARLREVTTTLIAAAGNFRELFLASRFAETLESASDCFAHAAQLLRGYLLNEVLQP